MVRVFFYIRLYKEIKAYAWVSDDILASTLSYEALKELFNNLLYREMHTMGYKERVSRESLKSMASLGSASAGLWEKKQQVLC